uniref:Uncharacterized protein n=1 Tax=Oryza rufipogon TaxID=4529 RepID=A0A0E0R0S6_ORYRU
MAAHRQHLQSQLWRLVDTAYGIKKFDPERRGRRVVSYKAYSVEGKIKASRACVQVKEVGKNASEERLIVVSSQEIPDDPVSPTIEALILLRSKAAEQIHGREDYRRLSGLTGYPGGSVELRIPNSYLESVTVCHWCWWCQSS